MDVNTRQRQSWIKNGAPRHKSISTLEVVFIGMIFGVFIAFGVAHEKKEHEKMAGFIFEKSESDKRRLNGEKNDLRHISSLASAMPTAASLSALKQENARRFERRREEQARREFKKATTEVYHF